jgi:CheY-like chemotaxis protein
VTRSVLVVDDDPVFGSLAARILSCAGLHVVATALDAATALGVALELKPDAALVDIGLPDRDGVELARELIAMPWHPQVLLTSTDRDAAARISSDGSENGLVFIPKEDLPSAPLLRLLARG